METDRQTPVTPEVEARPTGDTPTTEPTPERADKPARKAREKVRPISVLTDPNTIIPVKSLSEKEKILLIEHQNGEIAKLTQQVEAYRRNSEEAFKKAQFFEKTCASIVDKTNVKFNDIVEAVSVLYKTVYLIAKDGTNND